MTFKSEIVFVKILLPLALGICIGYLNQKAEYISPLTITCGFLFLTLCFLNWQYKNWSLYKFKNTLGSIYYLLFFFLGALICLLNTQSLKSDYFANQTSNYLKVYVANEPQKNNDILRFEAKVTDQYINQGFKKVSGKLLVALKVDSLNPVSLNYGDELFISAKYLPVEEPYNPAEFDFKAWLASKNIYHQTFINQNHLIKTGYNKGNSIIKYALETRKRQVDIYRKLIHNYEAFAVASTLVLGYRADLNKETLSAYSKTGTIHALSVSGMHVGIIYIFLNWALFFLDRNKALKIFKLLLISSLIWYYSLLTGFSPSVLRSAIMLTVYILAKSFNKNSNSYNILAFTAFCLLIYDPFLIWDVGFQLSFLAVFGLVYLQSKIYKWFYIENKWLDKLWATVALSLAAQIATFPLSIYYFHQFPLYFIFSNLFILLPLTVMMYLGIAILILRVYFLAPIFEWIITFTNNGLKWIADLPYSGITSIWIDKWQLILLSSALLILTIALAKYSKKLLLIALSLFMVLQCYAVYHKMIILNQRKIVFFSLRKNYAAAFINAKSAVLLTDLNNKDKNFEFFVKPALDQMQIDSITFVNWNEEKNISGFSKKEHQVNYYNYRILLIDKDFNYKTIVNLPKFETIWIHQNPKNKIEKLLDKSQSSTLLIDASNYDRNIENFKTLASKTKFTAHVLKKNNSYSVNLKSYYNE